MRQQNDFGGSIFQRRFFLNQRLDRNLVVGQNTGDLSQNTGLVFNRNAKVIRANRVAEIGKRFGLRVVRCRRHARALGDCYFRSSGDIDQVGHHGRTGRLGAGALAVVKRTFGCVAFHNDGVHCAFHISQQTACGDKCRMDAKFDAVIGVLRDAEQLNAVAEFFGKLNVLGFQMCNAFDMNFRHIDRNAEGNGRQKHQFMSGVRTLDVEGRIGFSVSQTLSFFEDIVKAASGITHGGEDKVAGSVDDAGDRRDSVGG